MSAPLPDTAAETARDAAPAADTGESRHRYPPRAVLLDYLYAGGGLVFTLGPLAGAAPSGPAAWVFGGLAVLFATYGARTLLRHRTWIGVGEDGLTVHGLVRRRLPWAGLTRCTLGYYSTRRNREGGWMQLTLACGGRRLKIDSQIEGFEPILRRAARAAEERGITLDRTTAENLRALGITAGASDSS